jgi:hypothetical protein
VFVCFALRTCARRAAFSICAIVGTCPVVPRPYVMFAPIEAEKITGS